MVSFLKSTFWPSPSSGALTGLSQRSVSTVPDGTRPAMRSAYKLNREVCSQPYFPRKSSRDCRYVSCFCIFFSLSRLIWRRKLRGLEGHLPMKGNEGDHVQQVFHAYRKREDVQTMSLEVLQEF